MGANVGGSSLACLLVSWYYHVIARGGGDFHVRVCERVPALVFFKIESTAVIAFVVVAGHSVSLGCGTRPCSAAVASHYCSVKFLLCKLVVETLA